MSLSNPLPRGTRVSPTYVGDGSTTTFAVPFWFVDPLDLEITVTTNGAAVNYTGGVSYTATGVGAPGGGTVTLTAAPAVGATVVITGLRIPNRTTSVVNAGSLVSAALETELDVTEATMQELRRDTTIAMANASSALSIANNLAASAGSLVPALRSDQGKQALAANVTGGLNWFRVVAAAIPADELQTNNILWQAPLWPVGGAMWGLIQTTLNAGLAGGFSSAQLAALQAQALTFP